MIFFTLVTTLVYFLCCYIAASDLTASNDACPAIDAKSVADVNDIIEDIFLITLNKGLSCFINTEFVFYINATKVSAGQI